MKDDNLLALRDMPACWVKERYGLKEDVRTLQRWARREYGSIPTRKAMLRDKERLATVRRMEDEGLHQNYCSVAQHYRYWPCLIRRSDVGLIFVCRKHAERGDF